MVFWVCLRTFRFVVKNEIHLCMFGVCVVLWIVILNAFIGFGVFFRIYEDTLKNLFLILRKDVPEVWTILVRTILFFEICWDVCGFVWFVGSYMVSPHPPTHPTPIPGVNVKVSFRRKKHGNKYLLFIFYDFYAKIERLY